MQDWRFDDLTRTLGKATSRRQVLKGLLAGLGLAVAGQAARPSEAAAAGCGGGLSECLKEARNSYHDCRTIGGGSVAECYQVASDNFDLCRDSRCPAGQQCCWVQGQYQCVDTQTDRNNCGACHHSCSDPNAICENGECGCSSGFTACSGAGFTICCPPDKFCVTDLSGPTCEKKCDPECPPCQTCVDGKCYIEMAVNGTTVECSGGQICCGGQCVDGPDCCWGERDGRSCNGDGVCCSFQCVNNQCPDPKVFSYKSCSCECPPIYCPSGQHQDPDTCQCVDLCANVTCGECQTCDPTSGACVDAAFNTPCSNGGACCSGQCVAACQSGQHLDLSTCQCQDLCTNVTCGVCQTCDPTSGACVTVADQTACGTGQVCCNGVCQDTCGTCAGLPCSNGDCCPNSTDWACCEDGCCPRATANGQYLAWCVAPGSQTDPFGAPAGDCCQPADLVKGSYMNNGVCECSGPYEVWCSNNLGTDLFGTRCSCGPWLT